MTATAPKPTARVIRAPRGQALNARSWLTEAPLRMLMNNLDPDVAERPEDLVVYGGIGKAARNWECFDRIIESLKSLDADETLLQTIKDLAPSLKLCVLGQGGEDTSRVWPRLHCIQKPFGVHELRAALASVLAG